MRNKILAALVVLMGFGALAALPAASARTANATSATKCKHDLKRVDDHCVCPRGANKVRDYCECPDGTQKVNDYCEKKGRSPQGPPTVDNWFLWGAKGDHGHGPALKFSLLEGINGAPGIKQFTLTLPDGLTFGDNSKLVRITDVSSLKITKTTLTATLSQDEASVLTYLQNHLLIESSSLRAALTSGKVTSLTFHVDATDANGKTTDLTFVVTPQA